MMVTLSHYLTLSALLFTISIAGIFLNRKNVIVLLMCVELLLLAVNFNFIAFSRYLDDPARFLCSLFSPWPPRSQPLAWPSWWCCSGAGAASTSRSWTC